MPPIEDRLSDLLNETRLAMLGAQLLLGLQYRAAFSPGFAMLPAAFQAFDCVALLFILVAAILLLATPAYHQIAERGHATSPHAGSRLRSLQLALLPLSLALAIDISLALVSHCRHTVRRLAGGVFLIGAWSVWYAVPLFSAARTSPKEPTMEDKEQSVETHRTGTDRVAGHTARSAGAVRIPGQRGVDRQFRTSERRCEDRASDKPHAHRRRRRHADRAGCLSPHCDRR